MIYMYPINNIAIVSCILLFSSCMCDDHILELTDRVNPNVVIGSGSDHNGNYTFFVPWGHANVHTVTHNGVKIWKNEGLTPLLFVRFYESERPRIVISCGKQGSEVVLEYELHSGCWKYLGQPTLGDDVLETHGDTGTTSTTGTTKDIDIEDLNIERLVIGSDTDESDEEIYEDMSGQTIDQSSETLQTTLETTGESNQHDFSQHDHSQVHSGPLGPLSTNAEFQGILLQNLTYEYGLYENIPLDTEEGEYQDLEYEDSAVYAQLKNKTENCGTIPESKSYEDICDHVYEEVIGSDSEKRDETSEPECKTQDSIELMASDDEPQTESGYERSLSGLTGRGRLGDDQGGTPDRTPSLPPRTTPRMDLREGEMRGDVLSQLDDDDVFGEGSTSRSSSRDAVSGSSSRSRSLLTSSTTSGSVSSTRSRAESLRRSFKKYVTLPLRRFRSRATSESSEYDDHIQSPTTPPESDITHQSDILHETDITDETEIVHETEMAHESAAYENKRDYVNVEEETGRRKKLKTQHKKDSEKLTKESRISLKIFKKNIRKQKKTKDKKKEKEEPTSGPEVIQVELGSDDDDDDQNPLLGS